MCNLMILGGRYGQVVDNLSHQRDSSTKGLDSLTRYSGDQRSQERAWMFVQVSFRLRLILLLYCGRSLLTTGRSGLRGV
jgi:hypothetical protein